MERPEAGGAERFPHVAVAPCFEKVLLPSPGTRNRFATGARKVTSMSAALSRIAATSSSSDEIALPFTSFAMVRFG